MAVYETVFIIRPDLDEEAVGKTCNRITEVITGNQGSVVSLEKVGHRRLAYEVKGYNDGFYIVLNYDGQPVTTSELERFFKISDDIIRYIIVKRETPFKKVEPRKAKAAPAAEAAEGPVEAPAEAKTEGQAEAAAPAPAAEPAPTPTTEGQ